MLRRKLAAGAGFVCLRCRLQLAGASRRTQLSTLPRALPLAPNPRRHIGSQTQRWHSSDDIRGQARQAERETDDDPFSVLDSSFDDLESDFERTGSATSSAVEQTEGVGHWQSKDSLYKPRSRSTVEKTEGTKHWQSQDSTYKSKGHLLAPKSEGLAIDILGKPGAAIVLREQRALRRRRDLDKWLLDDGAAAQVNPAMLLSSTDGSEPQSDDVLLNIHELKPRTTRVLPDEEFKRLSCTLVDGFTGAQLAQYIQEHEETQRVAAEEGLEGLASEQPPWILKRQPWVPNVKNAVRDIEPLLKGYITRRMAPKERLAIRLIRECWGLDNQRIIDLDGYLRIKLREPEFSLLTLGNRRWLEGTPKAILALVKEVKLVRESCAVSIVAPRHTADSILERINGVLSNARTADFAVDLVSSGPLEPAALEEVGRLTNTVTRLDPSGKRVVVTWIHMPNRDEHFEGSSELVMRLLKNAYGPKPRLSSALLPLPTNLSSQGRFLDVLDSVQRLPWQERFKKWERWTVALARAGAGSHEVTMSSEFLPFATGAQETADDVINIDDGWSVDLQTDTKVVFGHVVFSRKKQDTVSTTPWEPTTLDRSLPRAFIPILPPLGSLNIPNNLYDQGLWHTTLVVRFEPSPDVAAHLGASAPTLELRIEADNKELKRLISVRAVQDAFQGDVLFPGAAVDARLVQQRYFTLPGNIIEQHVPSILTFLSKSNLRPWEGKISTPPVLLGVRLPRRLFASAPPTNSNPTTATTTPSSTEVANDANSSSTSDDLVSLDYTLSSTEIQRTVAAAFQNLKLRYTSIQTGQRGGERAELSLEAIRTDDCTTTMSAADAAAAAAQARSGHTRSAEPYPPPTTRSLLLAPQTSDRYEFADEEDEDAAFASHDQKSAITNKTRAGGVGSHFLNSADRPTPGWSASGPAASAEPVTAKEFLRVASGIVHGTNGLRWHAKRS